MEKCDFCGKTMDKNKIIKIEDATISGNYCMQHLPCKIILTVCDGKIVGARQKREKRK